MLVEAFRPHLERYQPELMMDSCEIHLYGGIITTCNSVGVRLVIVPAELTWLLQPCDTHAFLLFKVPMKSSSQAQQIESPASELGIHEFPACVYDAVRSVLQGCRWVATLDEDGWGCRHADVSAVRQAALDFPPVV